MFYEMLLPIARFPFYPFQDIVDLSETAFRWKSRAGFADLRVTLNNKSHLNKRTLSLSLKKKRMMGNRGKQFCRLRSPCKMAFLFHVS